MIRHVVSAFVILMSTASLGITQEGLRADIPFSFNCGGKTLPAGLYTFREARQGTLMTLRNKNTGEVSEIPVLTRLAQRQKGDSEVVFDVVGSEHYLAEVHITQLDGFAFKGAPGKHAHVSVKVQK